MQSARRTRRHSARSEKPERRRRRRGRRGDARQGGAVLRIRPGGACPQRQLRQNLAESPKNRQSARQIPGGRAPSDLSPLGSARLSGGGRKPRSPRPAEPRKCPRNGRAEAQHRNRHPQASDGGNGKPAEPRHADQPPKPTEPSHGKAAAGRCRGNRIPARLRTHHRRRADLTRAIGPAGPGL